MTESVLTHSDETYYVMFRDDQLEAIIKGVTCAQYMLQFVPKDHDIYIRCAPLVDVALKVMHQGEYVEFPEEDMDTMQ